MYKYTVFFFSYVYLLSFLPVFTVYLQQFFERKRLLKRNEQFNNGLQTPLDRKSIVSQDIKGFCLLEQMHSTEMLCKYFFANDKIS